MAQSRTDIAFGNLGRGFQIGVNNGPIHLPPERPETPPSPTSTVPFLRDSDYVDRQALLEQVCEKCSITASRTALVGLGGVGKSQLAIEYSYRIRDRSPETWVLWVHASNAARLEQGFQEIAEQLKIAGRKDPKVNIFKLVHDWLRDEKKGKWLLILDNVDNIRLLHEGASASQSGPGSNPTGISRQRLLAYLPRSHNGSILITTRSREVALELAEQSDIIAVEPMDKAHALALFEKKLGQQGDSRVIAELAAMLEFMPLAIVQAAAYISQRGPRCSVQQYLEQFQKSDRKRTSLLGHKGGHLRRDREAESSIMTTWHISFNHIRQTRTSAADLLSLMSFFDRQGIPEALLRGGETKQSRERLGEADMDDENDNDEDSTSQSTVDDGFEDDILTLRNYSFISVNADKITFEMHGLVQLATRKWLDAHAQLERWKHQFIKNLCAEFPTGEHENWERCQSLFPHARSAIAQQPDEKESLREWASLLYNAAWYAWRRGNVDDAEKMSIEAMKTRKKLFGQEHEETLSSIAMVWSAYAIGGRWDEAEKMGVQVMEARKRVLGPEHPNTLTSMGELASTYSNQGRWKEAEELELQVMEVMKRVLRAEHKGTLASMGNLASTFRDQGRWKEAEELELQVMEATTRVLGAEHPDTLTITANLAMTYRDQGRGKEAEELELQVTEARKRVLGPEHPDTLTSMANLALMYSDQGRGKEAEELELQVMEARKRVLGPEHPDTLTIMANLASTFQNQGRGKEAEELFVQLMEATTRVLGAEHPSTLTITANLAMTYSDQGRWKEAEELELQVMEARKRVLGAEHPSTLTIMANLAMTYQNQGRLKEAEKLGVQLMETRKRILGAEHPDTLIITANLASTYQNQGRGKEAEELFVQVLETRKRVLGAEHPETLISIANLASTYRDQGRWKEAEELEVQVLETRKRVLGAEHPSTLISMGNLASTYRDQGRWKEAEELEVQVLEARKRVLGAEHPATLTSMANLAFTWKEQGRDTEALKLIEECVQIRTRVLGIDQPDTISSSTALIRWKAEKLDIGAPGVRNEN